MSALETSNSEDEVWFGEYTIKEAKRDILKYVPKKVHRRHSVLANGKNWNNGKKWRRNSNQDFQESCKLSKLQISQPIEDIKASNHNNQNDKSCAQEKIIDCSIVNISNESLPECESITDKNQSVSKSMSNEGSMNNIKSKNMDHLQNKTQAMKNKCQNVSNSGNNIISFSDDSKSKLQDPARNEHQNISHSPGKSKKDGTVISENPNSYSLHYESTARDIDEIINDSQNIINISDESLSQSQDLAIVEDPNVSTSSLIPNEDMTNLQSGNWSNDSFNNENESKKSSFGFTSLNISESDTEPKEYSCHIRLEKSTELILSNVSQLECEQKCESITEHGKQLTKISEKEEFTICVSDNSTKQQEETSKTLTSQNLSSSEISKNPEITTNFNQQPHIFATHSKCSKSSSNLQAGSKQISNNFEIYDNLQVSRNIDSIKKSVSGITSNQVPEIHIKHFDNSCKLNDSLEDVNSFLAHGNGPLLGPNDIISSSSINTSSDSVGLQNKSPITPRSLDKCKQFFSAEKIAKPSVEVKRSATAVKSKYQQTSKIKPPLVSARNLFTKHAESKEVGRAFKIPSKPVKKSATPSKIPSPTLKNVVSPVSIYINHSPKYCPMKKISPNTVKSSPKILKLGKSALTSVKENITPCASTQEFPKVIYRPATTKDIKEEKQVQLPASIKKLINEQIITKHERKIQDDKCNQSIAKRLMESDLSLDISHGNQDVSILTIKQPFNIRK